jgi:hypothetical protein
MSSTLARSNIVVSESSEHGSPGRSERQGYRDERSRRAVAAAVNLARAYGLRVTGATVLADLFSVMVHLQPSPVVARVSTWTSKLHVPIRDWLAREIEVTTFLAHQGAPVVAPSSELPPGPHEHDGFAISFWTYLQPDPDRSPTMADCSAMLADLHATPRTYRGELPLLAPAINDIPLGLDALDRASDILTEAEIDRLRPFLEAPGGDVQPLHGDVHPGNLVATRSGLVWIDFEEVCRGPVEWDLALMAMFGAADAVAAYHRPDPEMLARCVELRQLHVGLCLVAFRDDLGDREDWDDGIRSFHGPISSAA